MKKESVESLVDAISNCISGPGGDPIEDTLLPVIQYAKSVG